MASIYRCYLLSANDHIIGSQVVPRTDDEAAIRFAKDLCEQLPESCHGIELWDRDRLVMRHKHREGSSGELV